MAVETDIVLKAVGGDGAAGEIDKATQALGRVGGASGVMKNQFQERFQHIGLMLFAGDAMRASGLGRETRMVISTLNMALTEGATVAGISSGGLLLIVTALGALAAALVKVVEHHKNLSEELRKTVEEDTKHLQTLREKIAEVTKYQDITGKLNLVQKEYLATLKQISAEEAKKKNQDLIERIAALNLAIEKEKQHINQIDILQTVIKGYDVKFSDSTKKVQEHNQKLADMTQQLKEAEVQMNALHKTGTGTFADLVKGAKDTAAAAQKSAEDQEKYQQELQAVTEAGRKDNQEKFEKMVKSQDEMAEWADKQEEARSKRQEEYWLHSFDTVVRGFSDTVAKMLVEGTNFTQAMQQLFQRMAEQIISDLIRIEIEQTIVNSMTGGMGMVGGFGGFFATGGDVMVDRPTLFMAGEAGPERATFTPLASMGSTSGGTSDGGGVTIYIGSVETNVQGVNDPDRIARLVGPKLIQQIRGAGQLPLTKS